MAHVVYARIQEFYKIYVEDEEAEGKTDDEIEEIARQKLKYEGVAILCEDDMPFEYESDVIEVWYGYEFPDF